MSDPSLNVSIKIGILINNLWNFIYRPYFVLSIFYVKNAMQYKFFWGVWLRVMFIKKTKIQKWQKRCKQIFIYT